MAEKLGHIIGRILIHWVALPFILRGLWNTLAYEFNLPTFNFVFFLGCVAAIQFFRYKPETDD